MTRQFASKPDRKPGDYDASKENDDNLPTAINMKYKAFHDEDADVILDVSEELQKISLEEISKQEVHDPYADINLSRECKSKEVT